jgi:lipase ATG15
LNLLANAWQHSVCTFRSLYASAVVYLYPCSPPAHVSMQPSTHHITHVWHTADPVPMGTCTGALSTCGVAGYALESRCHLGNIIEYDTVGNLSWSVRLTTHPIAKVIEHILSKPWAAAEEQGLEVPAIKRQDDCVVRMDFLLSSTES